MSSAPPSHSSPDKDATASHPPANKPDPTINADSHASEGRLSASHSGAWHNTLSRTHDTVLD